MLIRGQIYYENKISKHKDFNVITFILHGYYTFLGKQMENWIEMMSTKLT